MGYGIAPSGSGLAVKIWNHEAKAWENAEPGGAGGADDTIAIMLVSTLPDYIDDEGYVWFLAETINASHGQTTS